MTTYNKFKKELRKKGLYGDYSTEALIILYGDYVINHNIENIIDCYTEYYDVFEFINDFFDKNEIIDIRDKLTKLEFTEDNIQPILDDIKDTMNEIEETPIESIYFLEDTGHVLIKKLLIKI